MYRYPAVLSGSEIKRRLGVSSRTALLLKRRLQLFFSDLMPAVREEFKEELEKRFKNFDLPEEGEDVSAITAVRPVLNMDTVALFSASQRANGGRSRHRHTGQTASIYLSDKVAEEKGKYQIGTLCHTMAIKNGPVILDCIPDQKQRTIQPLLNFLPSQVPIFTDEGYPWLSKYNKNHRAVNHSARAKDKKRNVWGRNRWCKKGVHNQAAEGFQRNLKHSFIAGYSYVTPQFAPLYLNEYAGIKSLRHYGLDTLAARRLKMAGRGECDQGTLRPQTQGLRKRDDSYLRRKIGDLKYLAPTLLDARSLSHTSSRKQIRTGLRELLDREDYFEARQAHLDYLHFWDDAAPYRKQLEKKYGAIANQLWGKLHRWDPKALRPIAEEIRAPHRLLLRIVRRWKKLKLARVEEYRGSKRHLHCYATRLTSVLPDLLYSYDLHEFMNQQVPEPERERPDAVRSTTLSGMDKAKRKQNLEEIEHG